ncbi:MAG: formylmethanofuran dehydrogenase subunit C [Planctomycetia bacterium]|nr:formylmethanofuran dehydrogenase subunit C [Planctomycetia bacterium]
MLTLTYRGTTSVPVELEGIVPDKLQALSPSSIERLPIFHGNQSVALGELFRVAGDASDEQVALHGELAGVHWIGAKMQSGTLRIEGNAGRHVGSELHGGAIHVAGNVADWLGAEMKSGLIHVRGSAGDQAGAAYRGSARGMTGGTLLIEKNSGSEAGYLMRRGLIAVGGDTGDFPAWNMIAGTMLVFGTTGMRAAAGMRRGTLAIFGRPPQLLPTFRAAGRCNPTFLRLYFAELRARGFSVDERLATTELRMHSGDALTVGKGEVLTRAS